MTQEVSGLFDKYWQRARDKVSRAYVERGEPDPAKIDWPAELPFLRWAEDGRSVYMGTDDDGNWGLSCNDGGVILEGTDPRVAAYELYEKRVTSAALAEVGQVGRSVIESIVDINNPAPVPLSVVADPNKGAFLKWIRGRNPTYAPTFAEAVIGNAFEERGRRLDEVKGDLAEASKLLPSDRGSENLVEQATESTPASPIEELDRIDTLRETAAAAETSGSAVNLDAKALAIFFQNPTWTKTQIAARIGCNKRSLAPKRCPKLDAAIKAYKAPSVSRGSKSADGTVEAWDE